MICILLNLLYSFPCAIPLTRNCHLCTSLLFGNRYVVRYLYTTSRLYSINNTHVHTYMHQYNNNISCNWLVRELITITLLHHHPKCNLNILHEYLLWILNDWLSKFIVSFCISLISDNLHSFLLTLLYRFWLNQFITYKPDQLVQHSILNLLLYYIQSH